MTSNQGNSEQSAPAPVSQVRVTDEMVEAGVAEIRKAKHTCFDRWTDYQAIRAVLEAALASEGRE